MANSETQPAVDTPQAAPQGVGIMVSYRELVEIRSQMANMNGQLTAALALSGRVDTMDKRIGRVENILSGKAGEKRTWGSITAYIFGVLSMALGGGATMYLPKLWARLHLGQ